MASKFSGVLKGIVDAGSKVKAALLKAVTEVDDVVIPEAVKLQPELDAVADAIVPGSASYINIAVSWTEDCAAALDAGDAAVEQNLLNAGLDAAAIAQLKALIPALKAAAAKNSTAVTPATSAS